jgi:putative hydrolase of the HAD superfamily
VLDQPQGRLRAVLFDWDGTLLDSYRADVHAYLGMFAALGVRWGERELRRHYSPDWYRLYRAARIPRQRWDEADRLWARFYRQQRPRLLPWARWVVRWVARRYRVALVTSGNRARVERQLRAFGWERVFAVRICCEDVVRRKPHPESLQLALCRLGVAAAESVYVGDAPEDVQMARRTGVCAVAVLGPFPTHRRLRAARPDVLLRSLRELPGVLRDGLPQDCVRRQDCGRAAWRTASRRGAGSGA